ncbi:MAG: hypothetical protein H0W73_10645 [Bacteroidetes bacterium]|nr:hypothetical protein [Bacteroidota bacterium]
MRIIIYTALIVFSFVFENCQKPAVQKAAAIEDLNYESLVQEKDSPLMFMAVEARIKQGEDEETKNKKFIYGTISNTAMQTKFRDVTLTIKYYSRNNDLIDAADILVKNLYEPNTRTKFELPVIPPDSMQTFDIEVKDARSAKQ